MIIPMTTEYGKKAVKIMTDFIQLVVKVPNIKSYGYRLTIGKVAMGNYQMNQPEISKEVNDFYIRIEYERNNIDYATMVKLVNTTDLKSVASKLAGSSPAGRTTYSMYNHGEENDE